MQAQAPSPRPRLGSRAISDMHPLINPAHNDAVEGRDLGRGTHATSGGARVTSGGRTALGGIAPMSPFLPLPPALQVDEVRLQQATAAAATKQSMSSNRHLTVHQPASIHLRSVSGSNVENDGVKQNKSRALKGAAHMIRSYSMPVATQDAYEAEREIVKRRHQHLAEGFPHQGDGERSWEASWVQGSEDADKPQGISVGNYHHHHPSVISAANSMVSSASSMGTKHGNTFQQESQRYTRKKQASPRLLPRSPLSIITINDVASSLLEGGSEMDLGSGSDEADVVTPRAASPSKDYFSKPLRADYTDSLFDFIHPDHLQPPSSCSL